MTTFNGDDDLRDAAFTGVDLHGARFTKTRLSGARFSEADLSGARFADADLSGVVVRGAELRGVELDSPWLFEGGNVLLVNGVDVLPFVEAELNRRFPGRAERQAGDPDGLRAAWAAVGSTWAATVERVAAMPDGTVDRPVDGEWSFAQTLRHLVLATDLWLGKAVLDLDEPMHPIGLLYSGAEFSLPPVTPSYAEVLEVRAGRMAMVGEFLATVTPEVLAEPRRNPHAPEREETVLHCLHVILEEEWEHHRYAVRDLDAVTS